jgi:hypothetical protein
MTGLLHSLLKSRSLSMGVHAALWMLLIFGLTSFHGTTPYFHDTDVLRGQPQVLPPVTNLAELYSTQMVQAKITKQDVTSPFYTRYFVPAPAPGPPPPPTTRKIEITYLGYYKTTGSTTRAMVRMIDTLVEIPVGSQLVTNLSISAANIQALVLTNNAGLTNLLPMNVKTIVEVPLK